MSEHARDESVKFLPGWAAIALPARHARAERAAELFVAAALASIFFFMK